MRTEQEMFDLILDTARDDERVRVVLLNGSRANPNAKRDCLQDFDIVYVVTDLDSYLCTPDWINCFGDRIVMQTPDKMDDPDCTKREHFAYLMQFADGNRIDLTLMRREYFAAMKPDSLTLLLLDKDGRAPHYPPPNEGDYLPQPPTALDFFNCCNEFWWVSPYVAKGLWREEILYAKHMLDVTVREQLIKLLTWYIGMQTGFKVNPGKYGNHFRQCLEPELWGLLEQTYAGISYEETWQALFTMTNRFSIIAPKVAAEFDFVYLFTDDEKVHSYIKFLYNLPHNRH